MAVTTYLHPVRQQPHLTRAETSGRISPKRESMRLEQEKLRRLLEQFSIKKKPTKTIFDTLVKHTHDAMESQNKDVNAPEALRKTERDSDIVLEDCKALHNNVRAT